MSFSRINFSKVEIENSNNILNVLTTHLYDHTLHPVMAVADDDDGELIGGEDEDLTDEDDLPEADAAEEDEEENV